MEDVVLKIEGMHCRACALGIEEALESLEFIQQVQVDFEKKEAVLSCQKEKFSMPKVQEKIEGLGFHIVNLT